MSSRGASRLVFDAGVLIALLDEDDIHAEWARSLYRDQTSARLLVNALTASESIVHAAREGRGAAARAAISRLDMEVAPLGDDDIVPLAELRSKTRLRMPDAVVLHTALRERGAIATTDARLARIVRGHGVEAHAPDDA